MEVIKRQVAYNYSKRTEPICYIVVHDTGNTARGSDAAAHFNYFNGDNRDSSADIFVDDRSAWYVNDYTQYYTWHCGDGKGQYGITNQNSVGVEMCVNVDGDYQRAMRNTADVVRKLAKELNIPLTHVVRHYDASRKNCPGSMSYNNWARWREFLIMLESEELTVDQYKELKGLIDTATELTGALQQQVAKLQNPMIYNYIDDNMPAWARPSVQWAVDNGIVQGDGQGLALDDLKLWILVVLHRMSLKRLIP